MEELRTKMALFLLVFAEEVLDPTIAPPTLVQMENKVDQIHALYKEAGYQDEDQCLQIFKDGIAAGIEAENKRMEEAGFMKESDGRS